MKTRLVLKPGDKGTRKAVREFGGRLVCVRYRYDEVNQRRIKTAEIILDEVPWAPGGGRGVVAARTSAPSGCSSVGAVASARVRIRLLREERDLQRLVKDAGGQWLPLERVWEIDAEVVQRLGLEERVVRST